MNNYPAIAELLPKIAAIAEKHAPDVLGVVTVECPRCRGGTRFFGQSPCAECDGSGRVLRDWSDLPDGALAGAWYGLEAATYAAWRWKFEPPEFGPIDDLAVTRAVYEAMRRRYG